MEWRERVRGRTGSVNWHKTSKSDYSEHIYTHTIDVVIESICGWQWFERQLEALKRRWWCWSNSKRNRCEYTRCKRKWEKERENIKKDKNFIQTLCSAYAYPDFCHFVRLRMMRRFICTCVLDVLKFVYSIQAFKCIQAEDKPLFSSIPIHHILHILLHAQNIHIYFVHIL